MGIDELIRQATIEFPRGIKIREAESLLYRIAEELPARINYCKHEYVNLSGIPQHDNAYEAVAEYTTASIKGAICSKNGVDAFDSFETQDCITSPGLIKGIRFALMPGWELHDYQPQVRKLWDDTRRIANDYFTGAHRNL